MPSGYAHYRFGKLIIPQLPADIRGPVLRQRALFDMGLHGPDFLFFHHFFKQTDLYRLGSMYHKQSGRDFFTAACAHAKQHPSEAVFAYLYGLLAHYCLDSHCHPFVFEMTDDTGLSHSELETEFDRHLMTLDGVKRPHEANISHHLRLKKEEYEVVAGFFPEASVKDVIRCIRGMALSQRLLTIPTPLGHGVVVTFTWAAGGNTSGKVMTVGPDPKCEHLDQKLLEFYQQALDRFPDYLEQLNAHLFHNEPFGDDFNANFDNG